MNLSLKRKLKVLKSFKVKREKLTNANISNKKNIKTYQIHGLQETPVEEMKMFI